MTEHTTMSKRNIDAISLSDRKHYERTDSMAQELDLNQTISTVNMDFEQIEWPTTPASNVEKLVG